MTEKNMKFQQVYRALLFARNILDYNPTLKSLVEDKEKLQENVNAVKITVDLTEEYRTFNSDVQDSDILKLMYKELVSRLEILEGSISGVHANVEQLNSHISQILEQVLPNGQGCIGISQDTFGEDFNEEYTYIFGNIKVFGKQVSPEMFFTSPSVCYKPSALPTSVEPIQSAQYTASENPIQPSSDNTEDTDYFDDEDPEDTSDGKQNQTFSEDDHLFDEMSSGFESSYIPD